MAFSDSKNALTFFKVTLIKPSLSFGLSLELSRFLSCLVTSPLGQAGSLFQALSVLPATVPVISPPPTSCWTPWTAGLVTSSGMRVNTAKYLSTQDEENVSLSFLLKLLTTRSPRSPWCPPSSPSPSAPSESSASCWQWQQSRSAVPYGSHNLAPLMLLIWRHQALITHWALKRQKPSLVPAP